jgi:hypothetical protein
MRNIVLAVILITVLVGGALGGTFARFVDTEEQLDDQVQLGSMDLEVAWANGQLGFLNDPLESFLLGPLKPEISMHAYKDVRNVGSVPGTLYLHIKNVETFEDTDKPGYVFEPEVVCETGVGEVGQEDVYSWPAANPDDNIGHHVEVGIYVDDGANLVDPAWDTNGDGFVSLAEAECQVINTGAVVLGCGEDIHDIMYVFTFHDFVDPTWPHLDANGEVILGDAYSMLGWWPSNCYMGDKAQFDVLYILIDEIE